MDKIAGGNNFSYVLNYSLALNKNLSSVGRFTISYININFVPSDVASSV
jgi:hypothetical protein